MAILGLLMMFGIAIITVALIWLLVALIKKSKIKKPLLTGVIGIVILIGSTFSTLFIGADYSVLDTTQGDEFIKKIQSGEDISAKTLELKVGERGAPSEIGVGLAIPSSTDHLTIVLESNGKTQAINEGDTVTVKMIEKGSLLGVTIISAELVE